MSVVGCMRTASPIASVANRSRGSWKTNGTTGNADDLINKMLEVDVGTYLPDDLLVKVDIASMAYSLEARSPLLDHRLMEFAAGLPGSLKLHGDEKKVVMRDALRGWIPDRILDGPKRGFGMPMIGRWFRGDLRSYIRDVLTDPVAVGRGYFDDVLRPRASRPPSGRLT